MSKKGSLSLSITAIVVIVIAFVVLGLGLGLTKDIFSAAQDKLPEAISLTDLEAEPTSSNPITLSNQVKIDRQKTKELQVGFYNKGSGTAVGATFSVVSCLAEGNKPVDAAQLPSITSFSQDVGASQAEAYQVRMKENGLPANTYICLIGVKCSAATCPDWAEDQNGEKYYETKQFQLTVIA